MSTELTIAIQEARTALVTLQKEIRNELAAGSRSPATNNVLIRASQNQISHAQESINTMLGHLVVK